MILWICSTGIEHRPIVVGIGEFTHIIQVDSQLLMAGNMLSVCFATFGMLY